MAGYRIESMFWPDIRWLTRPGLSLLIWASVMGGLAQAQEGSGVVDTTPRVALFSQPFCPGCEAAKQYFGENEVAFVEFDISSSPKARDAFERLGGRGTPFMLIDGKRVHGFSVRMIEQRLLESDLLEETP